MIRKALCIAGLCSLILPRESPGLINPNFTPRHLVDQADCIMVLKAGADDGKGRFSMEVTRCMKGKQPAKAPVLDLTANEAKDHAIELTKQLKVMGDRPVLLFSGKNEKGDAASFLHVTSEGELGKWYSLQAGADSVWQLSGLNSEMQAVWSGASDMLLRITDMLLKNPDIRVPVAAGANWVEQGEKIGKMTGKVTGNQSVYLTGDGRCTLFVASEGGDRIFQHNKKSNVIEDVTAALALSTASRIWAFGDFNSDGRTDLISWSGKDLSLSIQEADGKFKTKSLTGIPEGACLGLAVLGNAATKRADLVWTGSEGPVLLSWQGEALAVQKKFDCGTVDVKKLGAPAGSVVADLDGDSFPDVLWPFATGSVLFKGKADGSFEKGAACLVSTGGEFPSISLGDYDADGLLDIFLGSESSCKIWQNRGGGRFEETLVQSGEIEHVFAGRAVTCLTCDFNNDGLQDVFIAYGNRAPHLFFNRGFRSYGHALDLDLDTSRRLKEAHQGTQCGLLADLDGDGAQDMAVVVPDGDVWVIRRDVNVQPLCALVSLPQGDFLPGPATVTVSDKNRSYASWNLVAGNSTAFCSREDAGELTFKWRMPGGAAREKTIVLEKTGMKVILGDK